MVFPQLATGTAVQVDYRKRIIAPSLANRTADGRTIVSADPDGQRVQWDLTYRGLSNAEWQTIEAFFDACEGRLQSFTFLDPAANLLVWSEDLLAPGWEATPMFSITAGVAGPGGDGFHLQNSAATAGEIRQLVQAPPNLTFSFSAWIRGSGEATLRASGDTGALQRSFVLSSGWKRVSLHGSPAASGETVTFAVELPVAGQADVFGPQVEAQLQAGQYRKSQGRSGVYRTARFGRDALESSVVAANWVDGKVTVECGVEV